MYINSKLLIFDISKDDSHFDTFNVFISYDFLVLSVFDVFIGK